MMTELHNAARRGAQIVVLNPLRERALERFQQPQSVLEMATMRSTPIATHYYQVKIGGDTAALKGIMKAAIEADDRAVREDQPRVLDIVFIEGHTAGFEALCADLRSTPWPAIEKQSGLFRGPARRGGPGLPQGQQRHGLLRDGYHPTLSRHSKRAADRESVAAAREHRQTRRGHCPGARTLERAG